MGRDELLASLGERLSAFDRGDFGPILEPECLGEVDRLLGHVGNPNGTDWNVLLAVGLVHIARWELLKEQKPDEAAASWQLAAPFLVAVYLVDANALPDPVREVIADQIPPVLSPPEAGNAGRLCDLADVLESVTQITGNAYVFQHAIALRGQAVTTTERSNTFLPGYLATLGSALRVYYQRFGEPGALDKAIDALTDSVELIKSVDTSRASAPEVAAVMAELGNVLRLDFERTPTPATLEKAIIVGRRAVALCPVDAPGRAEIVSCLVASLVVVAMEDPAVAEEAVRLGKEAVALSTRHDPQHPACLTNLSLALQARHQAAENPDDVREAIERAREAVDIADPSDLNLPVMQRSLGTALLLDGSSTDDNLTEAESIFEQLIVDTPQEHANYASYHVGLATARRLQWQRDGDPSALDRAVKAMCIAVDAAPDGRLVPMWLTELAGVVDEWAGLHPQLDLVDQTIGVYHRLLARTPDDATEHALGLLALSDALRLRFQLTRDISTLEEALDTVRITLTSGRLDERRRARAKLDEGSILVTFMLFQASTEIGHDAEAVLHAALQEPRLEPALQATAWASLSTVLRMRYERTGVGLQEAIDAIHKALSCDDVSQAQRADYLAELSILLRERPETVEEAEQVGRQAIAECPREHPGQPRILSSFARTLLRRYDHSGNPAALDEAIRLLRETVETAADPVSHGIRLSSLAIALMARYHCSPDLDTLTEAITLDRQALEMLPPAHHERTKVLANLAGRLHELYQQTENLDSLKDAIRIGKQAVAATPDDHPALRGRLVIHCAALMMHFERTREPVDLEAVLTVARRVVAVAAEGHPDLAEAVSNLAAALFDHFIQHNDPIAAQAAVLLLREAVSLLPTDHELLPVVLNNLSHVLVDKNLCMLEHGGRPERADIDEAVRSSRRAVELTAEDAPERRDRLYGFAALLRIRYGLWRPYEDLEEAVAILRRLLEAPSDDGSGSSMQPLVRSRLAEVLIEMHERRPEAADLDEAVLLLEEARVAFPEDSDEQDRAESLIERAVNLRRRRDAYGQASPEARRWMDEDILQQLIPRPGHDRPEDELEQAFTVLMKLIGVGQANGQSRSAWMMELAETIMRYPAEVGLDEVMAKAHEIVERQFSHLPPEEREAAITQYLDLSGVQSPAAPVDTASVDEVLEIYARVLRELPDDHADRPLAQLGQLPLLLIREQHASDNSSQGWNEKMAEMFSAMPSLITQLADRGSMPLSLMEPMAMLDNSVLSPFERLSVIERSVADLRQKLARLLENDPEHTETLTALALAMFQHYQATYIEASFQEAASLARQLVTSAPQPDLVLLGIWGNTVGIRVQHAEVLGSPLDEDDLPSSGTARQASNQAARAIAYNDAPGALEELEEGRASMLSGALNTRRELENLRKVAPDLAENLVRLRERFLAETFIGRTAQPEEIENRRALANEWAELMEQIKALPGTDRFLMPLPLGVPDLLPAAAEGPVVTVNVNASRCDALALSADGVHPVALPNLKLAELIKRADTFHTAIEAISENPDGPLAAGPQQQIVLDTLGWLWEVLTEPVLQELGFTGPPDPSKPWPRLWWSPSGPLNFLPLHAAGHHNNPGASVLDRVVSSYTPTLRALLHSRTRTVPSQRTALSVALPEVPGHAPLPRTVREAAELARRIPGPGPIVGPAATREAVLSTLPYAPIAHFACHADSDPADVSASHLLLVDGPLLLTEVSKLHLESAELAYLSACGTARGSAKLADEAIHAASSFQLAGYSQAIATLWEIGDGIAARVSKDFYRALSTAIDEPVRLPGAVALHTVTRRLRSYLPEYPSAWAPLIHAGA